MEFLVKVDSAGNFHFADKGQEYVYKQYIDLYSRNGKYFKIEISENVGHTTDNQMRLFKRLVLLIAEASGDDYKSVYDDLHREWAPAESVHSLLGPLKVNIKDVSEMNKKEFSEFFERCVLTANEMFNVNLEVHYNDAGIVLTQRKNS